MKKGRHLDYTVFICGAQHRSDMNSCEFSICASHSICLTTRYVANATRIHSISSLTVGKTYRFYDSKNIEQTLVCISTKIFVPNLTKSYKDCIKVKNKKDSSPDKEKALEKTDR